MTSAGCRVQPQARRRPNAGGFYSSVFDRVKSIVPVGTQGVQINLKQPDYWLEGELSSPAGEVVEKAYADQKGDQFGTVTGGTMCSGPFKPSSWKTGQGLSMVPNPTYWDTSLPKPKLSTLKLIGAPDDATLTAGLETGSISGTYPITLSTLGQLEHNSNVKVYQGPAFATDDLVVSARPAPWPTRSCGGRSRWLSTASASSTRCSMGRPPFRTRSRVRARGDRRRASTRRRTTRCRR